MRVWLLVINIRVEVFYAPPSQVRRGTDVFKALALGADAVGLGKPAVFSMSAYGEDGIVKMLEILYAGIHKHAVFLKMNKRLMYMCVCVFILQFALKQVYFYFILTQCRDILLKPEIIVVPFQEILKDELVKVMRLCGTPTLGDLNPRLVNANSLERHADCAPIPPSPYVMVKPAKVRSPAGTLLPPPRLSGAPRAW